VWRAMNRDVALANHVLKQVRSQVLLLALTRLAGDKVLSTSNRQIVSFNGRFSNAGYTPAPSTVVDMTAGMM
jgi:hypothetical protein